MGGGAGQRGRHQSQRWDSERLERGDLASRRDHRAASSQARATLAEADEGGGRRGSSREQGRPRRGRGAGYFRGNEHRDEGRGQARDTPRDERRRRGRGRARGGGRGRALGHMRHHRVGSTDEPRDRLSLTNRGLVVVGRRRLDRLVRAGVGVRVGLRFRLRLGRG